MRLSTVRTGVCVALVARRHVDLCRQASAICS
ncbi:putative leader peptide [Streptomyces sp. VRA16 Mangrove soil]